MKLPAALEKKTEWTILGPLGPELPPFLSKLPLIAVDGGAHFCAQSDVWIGDSDSCSIASSAPLQFKLSPEKDRSDLALALALFADNFPRKLHFWGLLGGRKDHELFNLGEISLFLADRHSSEILLYEASGKVGFHFYGPGRWNFTHQGVFSLGSIHGAQVKLTGKCHYIIEEATHLPPLSSRGLSNQGHGEIVLECDRPVFVYFPEGK